MALKIAEVYAAAEDSTKRSLNQAFFKRLYVMPQWDEDQGRAVVRITGAELTEPYATLLADGLAEGILAEVNALLAKRASESRSGALKPFAGDSSYFAKLAAISGRSSNSDLTWRRIRAVHAQRFGR